jgi:charged multivesicular body protein 5
MRRLFASKKQEPPAPTLGQASERLGQRSAQLEKEIVDINGKLQVLAQQMRLPQNRARVPFIKTQIMNHIKRRKLLETELQRIEGARFNVDNLAFRQEQIQTDIQITQGLAAGTKVLKQQMKKVNVDGVDDVMMNMDDLIADANDIGDILSTQVGTSGIDDAELEDELGGLLAGDEALTPSAAAHQTYASGSGAQANPGLPAFYTNH